MKNLNYEKIIDFFVGGFVWFMIGFMLGMIYFNKIAL